MPLFEAVLRVTHDCPFCNISKKFPSLKMFVWCNTEHDILEVVLNDPGSYAAVRDEVERLGGIVEESSDRDRVHLFTKKCLCDLENSVGRNIEAHDLLHVPPASYEGGWEYYRVIAFRHEDLRGLLETLEERGFSLEVLRKAPFDGFIASSLTLTADALFSDLTEKQVEAVLDAYKNGYYAMPRRADIGTIASQRDVPRTTFQEHLRKAENKLVASLIPYLQLFKKASPEKRKLLRMK